MPKYTSFKPSATKNLKSKSTYFSTENAIVMGILNITEDSFFDGGKYLSKNKILEKCQKMLLEGASIIDIGAQSSRPGAKPIDFETEKKRLLTAISDVKQHFPDIIISVDTVTAHLAGAMNKPVWIPLKWGHAYWPW